MASLGCPPGPLLPSSLSLPFSDGVLCDGPPLPPPPLLPPLPCGGTDAEPGPGRCCWGASGVCAAVPLPLPLAPGGGRLGGGMEVSMVGRARAGEGEGP